MVLATLTRLSTLLAFLSTTTPMLAAFCSPPSPAFFPPNLSSPSYKSLVDDLSYRLNASIAILLSEEGYNATTASVLLTSSKSTLFSLHYSAAVRSDLFHGGAPKTNDLTNFRIASITKTFTVLAILQLQESGRLNLDDSVLKYIPSLNGSSSHNSLPWKDITLRSLASQQAGLPRDFAQGDMLNYSHYAALLGLPHLRAEDLVNATIPHCDEFSNYTRSCNASQFITFLGSPQLRPMFAPNQHSSYSNIGFDLLGLVIEAISNKTYDEYITTHILRELGMTHGSSFKTPNDSVAAITAGNEGYWSFEIGVQNPTGGLYANARDLGIWLRYAMGSFNAHAHGALNWFGPASYSGGVTNFYGLPWEILRVKTNDISAELESERALTLVSKGGGLPGYSSEIVIIPELELGLTILIAGNGAAVKRIWDDAIHGVVEVAQKATTQELDDKYSGQYVDRSGNSSLSLLVSRKEGLYIDNWTMNGTDVTSGLAEIFGAEGDRLVLNVAPLQLYINETEQKGERWRILPRKVMKEHTNIRSTYDDLCPENWEVGLHGGEILNEIVFWEGESYEGTRIELPAYRKTLSRKVTDHIAFKPAPADQEQITLEL